MKIKNINTIKEYIPFLMFGDKSKNPQYKRLFKFCDLAKALKVSPELVRLECNKYLRQNEQQIRIPQNKSNRLQPIQIEYLISEDILQKWKPYSLKIRTKLFHRQFPDTFISPTKLWCLYKKRKITYKKMKRRFMLSQKKKESIEQQRKTIYRRFLNLIDQGNKIIYADETIFKPYNVSGMSWAKVGQNHEQLSEGLKLPTLAVIAAISFDEGIEGYYIQKHSIKIEDIIKFIQNQGFKTQNKQTYIFWDNLRSHYNKDIIQQLNAQGCQTFYNVAYSSEFNPIEEVFSLIKRYYKQKIVENNFALSEKTHKQLVQQSIKQIENSVIQRIILRYIKKMQSYVEQ